MKWLSCFLLLGLFGCTSAAERETLQKPPRTYAYRIIQWKGGYEYGVYWDDYLVDEFTCEGPAVKFVPEGGNQPMYLMGNLRIEPGNWYRP
jgi:hypothetical protein